MDLDNLGESIRPELTDDQLAAYFDRIQLPAKFRTKSETRPAPTLDLLTALQRSHLVSIPFDNIALHYSTHHSVAIDPVLVFRKLVENGRGGYCMEHATLLGLVLHSLGYQYYHVGARISEMISPATRDNRWGGRKFGGWGHMLTIVTISQQKFLVDVGTSTHTPILPLPLFPNIVYANVGMAQVRLVQTPIQQGLSTSDAKQPPLWVCQQRHSPSDSWIDVYCFPEVEFIPEDFSGINYYVSNSRTSWFTTRFVCVRMLRENDLLITSSGWEGDQQVKRAAHAQEPIIVGHISIFDKELKMRVGTESKVLMAFESERDRVDALKKYFRIELLPEERIGIHGLVSEIL